VKLVRSVDPELLTGIDAMVASGLLDCLDSGNGEGAEVKHLVHTLHSGLKSSLNAP
jgi:hypothetical protein